MSPISDLFWQHIQSSEQLADFRRFLALFPDTTHSAEARSVLFDTPMRDDEPEEETLGQFMLAVLEADKLAKAGDAEAVYILGRVAADGITGFPRDASSAARAGGHGGRRGGGRVGGVSSPSAAAARRCGHRPALAGSQRGYGRIDYG